MHKILSKGLISIILFISSQAQAVPIVFSGSAPGKEGGFLAARVTFDIVGNILTVILENIANPAVDGQRGKDTSGNTLTGVYWDFTGNPVLTPQSATIAAGALIQANKCTNGPCNAATTNIAGEWGYQASSTQVPTGSGADRGIASSGYLSTGLAHNIGNFGPGGTAGSDLDDPKSLDGINFGIISNLSGNSNFKPNGGLANDPLIRHTARFTLSGALGLTNNDISDVTFQYGTSFSENSFRAIPEPGTVVLFIGGIALMVWARRKKALKLTLARIKR